MSAWYFIKSYVGVRRQWFGQGDVHKNKNAFCPYECSSLRIQIWLEEKIKKQDECLYSINYSSFPFPSLFLGFFLLLFLEFFLFSYFPDNYALSPKWCKWRKYMVALPMGWRFIFSFILASILDSVSNHSFMTISGCVWKWEFDSLACLQAWNS